MDHLAIPVSDQDRSRRFYESYCGFGARPARRYDDGVLMLYNAAGFALALGPKPPIAPPEWMHFGQVPRPRRLHHRGVVGAVVTGSKLAGSAGS